MGVEGHAAIRQVRAEVSGDPLAARVCALYLAGAGVQELAVAAELAGDVRALNSEVGVVELPPGPASLKLHVAAQLGEGRAEHAEVVAGDPVAAGARAARWVMARALQGAPR